MSRVDVVTGGGSAVYGSDAITGVVNFILDKNFSGVKYEPMPAFRRMPMASATRRIWRPAPTCSAAGAISKAPLDIKSRTAS